jgi:hypothetical protein
MKAGPTDFSLWVLAMRRAYASRTSLHRTRAANGNGGLRSLSRSKQSTLALKPLCPGWAQSAAETTFGKASSFLLVAAFFASCCFFVLFGPGDPGLSSFDFQIGLAGFLSSPLDLLPLDIDLRLHMPPENAVSFPLLRGLGLAASLQLIDLLVNAEESTGHSSGSGLAPKTFQQQEALCRNIRLSNGGNAVAGQFAGR